MNGGKGNLEREDIERLARLGSAARGLLLTGYNDQHAEAVLPRVDQLNDRFSTLSLAATERQAEHRAQQQTVKDYEAGVELNKSELSETRAKLDSAIEACDVDAVTLLNSRLPAIQLVITSLERRLEAAKQQLATQWQSLEGARSQVLDLRREVDREAMDLERIVATIAHDNDPALEEMRARHREMLEGRNKLAPRSSQPDDSKVIHLTRRVDELPIQVFTRPPSVSTRERGE